MEPTSFTTVPSEWDSQRPRKPEADLVTYLTSVEGSLSSGISDMERQALVRNVLEEIQQSEASLAAHKRASFVLETLLKSTKDTHTLARFLLNCKPYFGWLVYNRFSSHVIQTLFACIFKAFALDKEQMHERSDDVFAKAEEEKLGLGLGLGLGLVEGLSKKLVESEEWWSMMADPCATHSMRALLCVLKGKDPEVWLKPQRKGKSRRVGFVLRREDEEKQKGER